MKDRIGIVTGFLLGVALLFFGIVWPDRYANYYTYRSEYYKDKIESMQKAGLPNADIQNIRKEMEEFGKSIPGALARFLDLKSLMIVLGGTYAAILIAFPTGRALRAFVFIFRAFSKDKTTEEFLDIYNTVLPLGGKRAQGEFISDEEILRIKDYDLRRWLQDFIAVEFVSEAMIQEIIRSEIEMYNYRSFEEIDVLEYMGRTAPAFGMAGTVVGLIIMMGHATDVSQVMSAMSVALTATLYGVLLAQLVFLPVASKRYQLKESHVVLLEMIRESVLYLKRRELPEVMGQDLIIYLPDKLRAKIMQEKMAALREGKLGL